MATKKRYLASISNSYFDVQIFHFIDNSVDVNTICASIIGSPRFVFDSELSDVKTPLFIKALTFEVDVQLHYGASIDMFLMLMNGNCNYDAAYSNISGKKLLYCYVNNKIRSKEYYFQIMDDGFDIKDKSNASTLSLKFSDGLEKLSDFVQWQHDGTTASTRNSDWNTKFGTLITDYNQFPQIVEDCLSPESYDSDLNGGSFTVDFANPFTYPFEFKSSAVGMANKSIEYVATNYVIIPGSVISEGATKDTAVYANAYELLKQMLSDFGCALISEGLGSFKIVDILYRNGTEIDLSDIVGTSESGELSLSRRSDLKLNLLANKYDGTLDYQALQITSRLLADKYIFTRTQKIGSWSAGSNILGTHSGTDYTLDQIINISGLNPISSPSHQLAEWSKIILNQFMNINSPSDMTTYGYPGVTPKFQIPITDDYPEMQLFYPYYITYKSKIYYFFITKITRNIYSLIDEIEAISVMKLYY